MSDPWREARLAGRIPEDLLHGQPVDDLHGVPLDDRLFMLRTRDALLRTLEEIQTLPEVSRA